MFTSLRNEIFLKMRSRMRFARRGYREIGTESGTGLEEDTILERNIIAAFAFKQRRMVLSPLQWKRNLATLWLLNCFTKWSEVSMVKGSPLLEVGCQDFSRLPALKHFFQNLGCSAPVHGLELDPFPVLSDLHSRWDRAQYYISLMKSDGKNPDQYFAGDFFTWEKKTWGLLCFFPFVTPGPALSWGLPQRFGQVEKWLKSIDRCLENHGFLFVVHQGDEEEKIFDEARHELAPFLKLLERKQLSCPFWLPKKPSCASLYVRDNGTV
jgi:hypothetical protein